MFRHNNCLVGRASLSLLWLLVPSCGEWQAHQVDSKKNQSTTIMVDLVNNNLVMPSNEGRE